MNETQTFPNVDEVALQSIAQNAAGVQAAIEQIITLSSATAKAITMAKQAVSAAVKVESELTDIKTQVQSIDRKLQERVTIDGVQEGALYQAVHDRAAWAVKHFPDDSYQTHISRIWTKIKRDLVVSQYRRILEKDYSYAMQAVLAYPGFGRNWKVA